MNIDKKKLFIAGGIVVLVIVVISGYLLSKNKSGGTLAVSNQANGHATTNGSKLVFQTDYGQFIPINNFADSGLPIKNGAVVIFSDSASAEFTYNVAQRTFVLTYNQADIGAIGPKQAKAEAKVLDILGVDANQACQLPIVIKNDVPSLPVYLKMCAPKTKLDED